MKTLDPNEQLMRLFDDYHEYQMRNFPEWATYQGDYRYEDKLTDHSDAAASARYDSLRSFLKRLASVPFDALTPANKINYDLFKQVNETDIEGEKFHFNFIPLSQRWGIHLDFPVLISTAQKLETAQDYEKCFSRLKQFPKQVDDVINNMKAGIGAGLVLPEYIAKKIPPQIEKIINIPPEQSPFYMKPGEKKISDEDKSKIKNELIQFINTVIKPAYAKLYDFFNTEYIPQCRRTLGAVFLPNGKELYIYSVKNSTTTELSPDEIFELGMKEVDRIESEMEKTKNETGFSGTLDEFNKFLQTDTRFYYSDKQDLLNDYKILLDEIESKLPSYFGRLPKTKVVFRETEEYRSREAVVGEYQPGSRDGSRPGTYYVNTYDLKSHPKYYMAPLTLHESIPGHHLQISLAQELENVPKFRANLDFTSFIEGWALYCEYLGYEMGMYKDAYSRYGALSFESWRACRLVVDTGIHYKGWTYEQAFDFMKKHTAHPDDMIKSELDRYIVWPGQALAYKIGQLKIKELRKKAEEKLGSKFNIKNFHDELLQNGPLPLPLLEKIINEWIASQ